MWTQPRSKCVENVENLLILLHPLYACLSINYHPFPFVRFHFHFPPAFLLTLYFSPSIPFFLPFRPLPLLFTMLLWCGNGQIGNWLTMAPRKRWEAVRVNKIHNAHKTNIAKDLRISMSKITSKLIRWSLKWLLRDNLGLKSWTGLPEHLLTVAMMVRKVKKLHEIAQVPQEQWVSC